MIRPFFLDFHCYFNFQLKPAFGIEMYTNKVNFKCTDFNYCQLLIKQRTKATYTWNFW